MPAVQRESRDLKQFTFVKVTATITYEVAWIDNGVHHPQPRSQTSLLPVPTERERERPWLGLVTWFQNKINSEGGVLCLSVFFVWFVFTVHTMIARAR